MRTYLLLLSLLTCFFGTAQTTYRSDGRLYTFQVRLEEDAPPEPKLPLMYKLIYFPPEPYTLRYTVLSSDCKLPVATILITHLYTDRSRLRKGKIFNVKGYLSYTGWGASFFNNINLLPLLDYTELRPYFLKLKHNINIKQK